MVLWDVIAHSMVDRYGHSEKPAVSALKLHLGCSIDVYFSEYTLQLFRQCNHQISYRPQQLKP